MKYKILSITLLLSSLLVVGCVEQPKVAKVVEKPKPKKTYAAVPPPPQKKDKT